MTRLMRATILASGFVVVGLTAAALLAFPEIRGTGSTFGVAGAILGIASLLAARRRASAISLAAVFVMISVTGILFVPQVRTPLMFLALLGVSLELILGLALYRSAPH